MVTVNWKDWREGLYVPGSAATGLSWQRMRGGAFTVGSMKPPKARRTALHFLLVVCAAGCKRRVKHSTVCSRSSPRGIELTSPHLRQKSEKQQDRSPQTSRGSRVIGDTGGLIGPRAGRNLLEGQLHHEATVPVGSVVAVSRMHDTFAMERSANQAGLRQFAFM